MIPVNKLRKLLAQLPDDARIIAYEGEGIGLRVVRGKCFGWIETGYDDNVSCNEADHDLSAFGVRPSRDC